MPPGLDRAADALAAVAPLASRWIERVLAAGRPPLTVAEYLALRSIDAGETSPGGLAVRASASEPAVSQLLGGLDRDGLVARVADAGDRRWRVITVTPLGAQALRAETGELRAGLASVIAAWERRRSIGSAAVCARSSGR